MLVMDARSADAVSLLLRARGPGLGSGQRTTGYLELVKPQHEDTEPD